MDTYEAKAHIRPRRPGTGKTLGEIIEREKDYFARLAENPDMNYCGNPGPVYASVDAARAASVADVDICPHCAGWDVMGIGSDGLYWAEQHARKRLA